MLEQGTCDTQSLFLPSGDVGTILFDIGFIPLGELLDESICLGNTASPSKLLIARMLISPAEIFCNCPTEKEILLQYHAYLFPETFQRIVSYIHSSNLY